LNTPTFHWWSRLPDELKVEILAHHLDQPDAIDGKTHKKIIERQLSPIIGTQNRQLVSIALETYYTRNTIVVTVDHNKRVQFCDVNHPPAAYGHFIRKMTVHARACIFVWSTLEELLVLAWTGWSRLLTPTRPLDQKLIAKWAATNKYPNLNPDKNTWQESFPNLRTLHLTLSSYFPYNEKYGECKKCDLCSHRVQDLAGILKETRIGLKAKKATATIERVPLDYGESDGDDEDPDEIMGPLVICKYSKRLSDRIVVVATKPKEKK
jgi:hypothetical protein